MRQFGRDTQLNGEDVEGRIGENNDRKEQRWVRVMGEGRRDTDRERSLRDGKWTMENVANRRIGYSVMDMAPKNFKSPLKILFQISEGSEISSTSHNKEGILEFNFFRITGPAM